MPVVADAKRSLMKPCASHSLNVEALIDARNAAQARLIAERPDADGHWTGRLSSSSLATAIAAFALFRIDRDAYAEPIRRALRFVVSDRNADGGWGDCPGSPSNLTATVLVWSALATAAPSDEPAMDAARSAELWIATHAGSTRPSDIAAAVERRYGNDRTFAAPILTLCVLACRLGAEPEAWRLVPQLPYELAVLPFRFFKWLRLTVVSYALPALIAIGLVRRKRAGERRLLNLWRDWVEARCLRIVERMQPEHGGYEEAAPLTAFVALSLACAGYRDCRAVRRAVSFLLGSMRDDGSLPIDTNLATWVTTLSVNALAAQPDGRAALQAQVGPSVKDWLLAQQHTERHALTHGAPGGWAWTDLPGGMPDADDTCSALLALRLLGATDAARPEARVERAVGRGLDWLLSLQNRDGGIPTFSKGWGRLPFDRSCPDITAHAIRVLVEWRAAYPSRRRALDRAIRRALRYLRASRLPSGAWIPLWFGSQYTESEENPTYGTAQVLIALEAARLSGQDGVADLLDTGYAALEQLQNHDGGWGGDGAASGIEDTALALVALAGRGASPVLTRGGEALLRLTRNGTRFIPAPIGLYFARLWYAESLYPLIFSVWAFARLESVARET